MSLGVVFFVILFLDIVGTSPYKVCSVVGKNMKMPTRLRRLTRLYR